MTFWFFRWPISLLLHHKPLPFPYEYISLLYTDWSRSFSFRQHTSTPPPPLPQTAIGKTPKRLFDHDTPLFSAFPLYNRLPQEPPAPQPKLARYSGITTPHMRNGRSLDTLSNNNTRGFPFKYNGARSRTLEIQIGKKGRGLDWSDTKLFVDRFLVVQAPAAAGDFGFFGNLSLDVKWHQDSSEFDYPVGFSVLRTLFCYLANQEFQRPWPRFSSILGFRRISITVPTTTVVVGKPGIPASKHDCIRLEDAVHLKEFHWNGDLWFLTQKIDGLPYHNLSVLAISGCAILIADALNLLRLCPNLTSLALETIEQAQQCDQRSSSAAALHWHGQPGGVDVALWNRLQQPKAAAASSLPRLEEIKITSNAPLLPLFEGIRIRESGSLEAIYLVLDGAGTRDLHEVLEYLPQAKTFRVRVRGCPTEPWEAERFRRAFPSIRFNSR